MRPSHAPGVAIFVAGLPDLPAIGVAVVSVSTAYGIVRLALVSYSDYIFIFILLYLFYFTLFYFIFTLFYFTLFALPYFTLLYLLYFVASVPLFHFSRENSLHRRAPSAPALRGGIFPWICSISVAPYHHHHDLLSQKQTNENIKKTRNKRKT